MPKAKQKEKKLKISKTEKPSSQTYEEILLDPNKIVVDERQRTEAHTDLALLAKSIMEVGQLNPIIVDAEDHLVAGLGRVLACQLLQREVRAVRWDSLDEVTKFEIELEENIRRTNLSWADRAMAEEKLFELRQKKYGASYTQQKFAEDIGISQASVADHLAVAKLVRNLPELAKLPSKNDAVKFAKKKTMEVLRDHVQQRAEEKQAKKEAGIAKKPPETQQEIRRAEEEKRLFCARAEEFLVRFPDEFFDLVCIDPPFGIELMNVKKTDDNDSAMSEHDEELYGEDTKEMYIEMMEAVIPLLYKKMSESSHLWMFFGIDLYEYAKTRLIEEGFLVDNIPLIWVKLNFAGQTHKPEFNAGRVYETFLFARKGMLHLARQGLPNVIQASPVASSEKIHPAEKPAHLYHEIISRSASSGQRFCDCFFGAGASMEVAKRLGLDYYGCDRTALYVEATIRRLMAIQVGGATNA